MSFLKQINRILTNKKMSLIIESILILYAVFIVPHMLQPTEKYTKTIIRIFNNSFFKLFIFSVIGHFLQINLRLGLFLLISWSVTNDTINKYITSRKILRLINGENKLREIKLEQLFQPIKQNNSTQLKLNNSTQLNNTNQEDYLTKSQSVNSNKILMEEVNKTIIKEIKMEENFIGNNEKHNETFNITEKNNEINGMGYLFC